MKKCKWHKCAKPFEPTHHLQHYCAPACQRARGAWIQRRGGPIAELLLASPNVGDAAADLVKIHHSLHKEVSNA
jgi:hypothetical protein